MRFLINKSAETIKMTLKVSQNKIYTAVRYTILSQLPGCSSAVIVISNYVPISS